MSRSYKEGDPKNPATRETIGNLGDLPKQKFEEGRKIFFAAVSPEDLPSPADLFLPGFRWPKGLPKGHLYWFEPEGLTQEGKNVKFRDNCEVRPMRIGGYKNRPKLPRKRERYAVLFTEQFEDYDQSRDRLAVLDNTYIVQPPGFFQLYINSEELYYDGVPVDKQPTKVMNKIHYLHTQGSTTREGLIPSIDLFYSSPYPYGGTLFIRPNEQHARDLKTSLEGLHSCSYVATGPFM